MSEGAEPVYLSPQTEAGRLWRAAQEALHEARHDVASLSRAIDFGVRVVEILVTERLQQVRGEFPATIANLLEPPPPDVDPERDFLHPPQSLRFIDALDMLSEADLTCIDPPLHHGWEDRIVSCRRSRARAKKATGVSIDKNERDALMLIGAYRNRIFVLPPPVRIAPIDVLDAFPALVELVRRLFASAEA